MEDSCLLIVNPKSGDGIAKHWIYEITRELSKKYRYIDLHYTSNKKDDVIKTIKDRAKNATSVIVAGGDGTLSDVCKGMYYEGLNKPIGIIPAGTMNDFVVSHKMSNNISDALYDIINGEIKEYDMFLINDIPCIYIATFASFIDLTYGTPQKAKESFGNLAYVVEGLKRVPQIKGYRMWFEEEGKIISGNFIVGFVSNSPTGAGFRMFPDKEMDERLSDGKVDITLVKHPEDIAEFSVAFSSLVSGANHKFIYRTKLSETTFHFETDDPKWTLEGERGPSDRDVRIKVLPKRVKIITGKAEV